MNTKSLLHMYYQFSDYCFFMNLVLLLVKVTRISGKNLKGYECYKSLEK